MRPHGTRQNGESPLTWSPEQIEAALAAARALVRSDGADLALVEADAKTARVVLRLEIGDQECSTGSCVMPGPVLDALLADAIGHHLPGELELRLIDPRRERVDGEMT